MEKTLRTRRRMATVIVGAGSIGCRVARTILERPDYGLEIVGMVDDGSSPVDERLGIDGRLGTGISPRTGEPPVPVLGGLEDLGSIIERHGIRRLLIAFGSSTDAEIVDVLRSFEYEDLEVYVLPRLFELGALGGHWGRDELWGYPLIRRSRSAMSGPSWWAKRALDLIVSGVALVVVSPLVALAALAMQVESRGPVFFKQERVGERGRLVRVYKLRSMPVLEDSDTRWKVDARVVGPVGRFLRQASIDELPQLINVFKGDMSLVGPRPERVHFVTQFCEQVPGYADRHRVPVGLTGWAQVHGLRGDTSIEDRARFDNYYIDNWSVWLDLVIMARTFVHVLRTAAAWRHPDGTPETPRVEATIVDLTIVARDGAEAPASTIPSVGSVPVIVASEGA